MSLVLTSGLLALLTHASAPEVPYADIAASPEDYLGKTVRVTLQHHSTFEEWEPYVTRFGTAAYFGVNAWSDEQLTWVEEQYQNPVAGVFARRRSNAATVLSALEKHERFEAVCVVRETFRGRPWIEVLHARELRESIPEGSVLHAIRGIEFMDRNSWSLAIAEFDRALVAPLPAHAVEKLELLKSYSAAKIDEQKAKRIPVPKR